MRGGERCQVLQPAGAAGGGSGGIGLGRRRGASSGRSGTQGELLEAGCRCAPRVGEWGLPHQACCSFSGGVDGEARLIGGLMRTSQPHSCRAGGPHHRPRPHLKPVFTRAAAHSTPANVKLQSVAGTGARQLGGRERADRLEPRANVEHVLLPELVPRAAEAHEVACVWLAMGRCGAAAAGGQQQRRWQCRWRGSGARRCCRACSWASACPCGMSGRPWTHGTGLSVGLDPTSSRLLAVLDRKAGWRT